MVTKTTPVFASLSDILVAGVQTLRYRQSSLISRGKPMLEIGLGPNLLASLVPSQGTTGWGAFHLRSPTGGAAKGIPLNTSMSSATVPRIMPPSTFIRAVGEIRPLQAARKATDRNANNNLFIDIVFYLYQK